MTTASSAFPSSVVARFRGWRPTVGGFLRGLGRFVLGVVIAVAIFVAIAAVTSVQSVSLPAVTGSSAAQN